MPRLREASTRTAHGSDPEYNDAGRSFPPSIMKYLALLAVAVVALTAFLLLRQPDTTAETIESVRDERPSASAEPELALPSSPPSESSKEREAAQAVEVDASSDSEQPAPGRPVARVKGSVLDQDGAPLDARVQLTAYPWPEDSGAIELVPLGNESHPRTQTGFETRTGKDGRFEIEAPFAADAQYILRAVADPFHDSVRLFFGRDGVAPLLEGDVDVGEFRLATAGAIRGTVTDSRGAPIADATLDTGPGRSSTYSRGSLSRDDGSFLIPHAPIGTYLAKVKAKGFLSKQEEVTVEVGANAGPVHFVLADAPRIEARVVDDSGQPIENVRFWGWPKSSGSGAGARSAADGTVVIYLPQDEPYTMEATHPDYEKWGSDDRSVQYEPGSHLGTITMRALEKIRFEVVDGTSGEALDAFGLRIVSGDGSAGNSSGTTFWSHPRVKPYPDRFVDLSAKPRFDAFVAYAPGFLMKEGDVMLDDAEPGADGPRRQRIVLDRGAGIRGRLTWKGEPVPDARIEIVPDAPYSRGEFSPDERFSFDVSTDAEGRFETTGLRPRRRHRFTAVRAGGQVPLLRILEPLGSPEVHDLGDMPFLQGGSIAGKVVLPDGIDPGGLTVFLGDWKEDNDATTDSTGALSFSNVPPGDYTIGQRGRPDVIESGGSVAVTVEPEETAEVEFDLSDRAMLPIEIEVAVNGELAPGARVELVGMPEDASKATLGISRRDRVRIGKTDELGVARAKGRAIAGAQVNVVLPHGIELETSGAPLEVQYGPPFHERVDFDTSTISLSIGEGIELPRDGSLYVTLQEDSGRTFPDHRLRLELADGAPGQDLAPWITLDSNAGRAAFTIRGVPPGSWKMSCYAIQKGAPKVETKIGNRSRFGPKEDFRMEGPVTLTAGITHALEVTSEGVTAR